MKENLRNKKNGKIEKGITLVALVVTIVVLLILAGVTIVTLFGESGIITAAQKAADQTKNGANKDLEGLKGLEYEMDNAFAPKVVQGKLVDKEIKVAKYIEEGTNSIAYIPGGYGVVQDSTTDTDNARKVNTIANGLVISDLANDTLDNDLINGKRGNQFVWIPVPDIASMYDEEHNAGKLYDYGTKSSPKASPEVRDYPRPNSGYREPDVVTGASGSDSTIGKEYDGDVTNLNIITDFTVAAEQTKTAALFKQYLQKEFNNMIESVKKYKGFYIGRYETGNLSNTNSNTVKAVVQKGNSKLFGASWYAQYQEIKNMTADNSNVTTSMIWGCQWDRTLNWFIETGTQISDIVDSSTWGNYSNNTEEGHGIWKSSGYSKAWQKNHIYDMAGNVFEKTIECSGMNNRVMRGGFYSSSFTGSSRPVSHRNSGIPTNADSGMRFSRYTLCKFIT